MDMLHKGSATSFRELPHGSVFLCSVNEKTHLAFKAFRKGPTNNHPMAVILSPPHPISKTIGMMSSDLVGLQPVFQLPEAMILPSLRIPDVLLGELSDFPHGAIARSGSRSLIVVDQHPNSIRFVDLDSGEIVDHLPPDEVIWFMAWSMVQPGKYGYETLFTFPSSGGSADKS